MKMSPIPRCTRVFGVLSGSIAGLAVLFSVSFAGAEESIRVVTGVEALHAEIAGLSPAARKVLLFGPDDHLFDLFLPLRREKKIDSLAVVVPSESPMSDENLTVWRGFMAKLAPGADNAFVLRDGAIDGSVEGLFVRIGAIKDWKDGSGGGPAILDLAFLLAMYKDEVRTPFVDLPRKFMATLENRKLEPSRLRLWTADRAAIPLAYGYLPRLTSEVARDPAAFRDELPAKWEALRRGEYLAYFGAHEEAVPHLEKYLKEEPEDPAILFKLAQMSFVDREIERGLRFLRRACKADAYYIRGFSESALQFFRKGELENAERVVRAGLLMEPSTPDLKQGLAYVLLEQAKKLLPRDGAAAESRFSEIGSVGVPDDLLAAIRKEWNAAKSAPPASGGPATEMPQNHPKF